MKNFTQISKLFHDEVMSRASRGQVEGNTCVEHFSHKALMLLFAVLVMSMANVGLAWGASPLTITDPDQVQYSQDGITVSGTTSTAKFGNVSSKKIFLSNGVDLHIFSENVNITGISFDAASTSGGSGTDTKNMTIKTSASGTNNLAVPTSGFTATNEGSSLTSLSDIGLLKDGASNPTTIEISFHSPVKIIEICKGSGSNGSRIRNITITYNLVDLPTVYFKATITGQDAATINTNPGGASITVDSKSSKATVLTKDYYQMESGTTTINLGTGNTFQVGDQIVVENLYLGMNINSQACALTSSNTVPSQVAYVIAASDGVEGTSSCNLTRIGGNSYVHSIRVLRAAADCEAVAAPTGLTCSAQTQTSLTFGWTKASNASGYVAKLWGNSSCTGDAVATENIANGNTETVTFSGLTAGTTYYCKVQSKGDGTDYCAEGGTTSAADGTTDACTVISPTWSYPFSTVAVGITIYPTIGGNTGEGDVTYTSSATSKITNACYATAAGSAILTANVAAKGVYCSGSVTSGTITVVSDQSGLIKQTLTTGESAWGTPSAPATTDGTNITSTTVISNTGLAIDAGNGNTSNGGQTAKITGTTNTTFDDSKYISLGFTVKSDKQLNVSAIYIPVQPVGADRNEFKAVLSDGDTDIEGTISNVPNGKLTYIKFPSYGTVKGNVTLKIYAWNWTSGKDGFRLGKSIVIDGEIEDAPSSCTAPTAVSVTQTEGSADMIAGESFTLSAATSTGVEEGATYQWYRNSTEVGTNSPTFTVPSCTKVDAGTYWCKITNPCSADAHTTNVTGFGIKVWQVLLYESSTWNSYDLTSTGTKTGRMSRQLAPGTYYIKLTHNNGVDFGVNTGETISEISATTPSPWTLYGSQNKIKLTVTTAGEYTFDVNYTSADYPTLSVTYPPSTISSCDKIYFCPTVNSIATGSAKFSIYFYNATQNAWANCYLVDGTDFADDAKYVAYAPAPGGWTGMIVVRYSSYISNWDNKWNQSEDITYNGYNYIVGRNEWTSDNPKKFKTHLNSFYSSTTPAMNESEYCVIVGGTTTASTNLPSSAVTYTSDNTSVATVVASTGVITGVAAGTATITAKVGTCTVGTATVTVYAAPSVTLSASSVTYGSSAPTLTPSNFATVTGYSSSTEGTATINGSGVISIAGAGTTTFTVTGTDQCGNAANATTGTFTVNKATPTTYAFSADNTSICSGGDVTFTIAGSQTGATYYVTKNSSGGDAIGESKAGTGSALSFTVSSATAGDYYCYTSETTNYTAGKVSKGKVTITHNTATSITTQPTNQEVTVGEEATLSVVAAGTSLSYQWKESATEGGTYSDVSTGSGKTSASYSVTPAAAGTKWYKCVVTGTCGEVTTEARKIVANAAVTYTVTYVYNGADGGSQPASVIGSSVSLPNPTKTGYTLQGWYTSSGSLAGAATATYNPTSNITLYALWREDACAGGGGGGSTTLISITPTITNDNKNNGSASASGTPGGTAYWDKMSTSSPYKLNSAGAYFALKLSTGYYQATDVLVINGADKAHYVYYGSHGSGTALSATGDPSSGTINFTLTGLPSSVDEIYVYRSSDSYNGKLSSMSVTRAGGSGTCYYVTYNGNGADGGFTKDEASHASGSNVTVASNSFTKTGYRFTGWNTDRDGDGTAYTAGGTISSIAGNMTLYAQWEEEGDETTYYLVTSTAQLNATDTYIIANSSGTAVMSTTTADTDKNPDDITTGFSVDGSTLTVTSASPNLFKLTSATNGWLFKGGNGSGNYLSSDGTPDADLWYNTSSTPPNNTGEWAVSFSEGIATMKLGKTAETTYHIYYDATNTKFIQSTTASNIKIYTSNSTPVYTVTYANGGATSGSVPTDPSSPHEENDEVTVLGNTGGLAKNGYTFGGWSADVDLVIDEATATAGTTIAVGKTFPMPAEDVTLTAVWTPNTYDITYNLNGASWAGGYSAPANYTVGTGATLPIAANMTNTGYTFGGWFADDDLETGGVKTEVGTSEYGNKEFWAKWTEKTYTITYDKNNGSATGSTADTEGHYVTVADCGFELADHLFTGWNTETDGSGESYNAGEDIELTADMTLYAQWATDYTISWGNVQIGGAGVTVKPNLGGGNYTITASTGSWTGTLDASMISSETSGVSITNVVEDNSGSPKTITVTFAVGAEVVGESIGLTLSVPAAGVYGAKESTKAIAIDRCTGSGGGSDGVLFSAEFKDSGLGTSDICDAANTPYTFTTAELKSAAMGGSIKASTTSNLSHMKFATNAISIAGSDGVIRIDLDNAIQTNDLFTYVNVNSSTSSAYLRHTLPTNTTDQIALTGYNSQEKKVMLPAGYNGKTTLYIVRNNKDFKLHKAAVVRPAFLMLLRDDAPTSDTNLEGTDVEMTTSTYLTTIQGGRACYTSPSSGNLKIKRSNSKNYINFNNAAGYVKIVLNEALQEGDVIGFDSYNTNELALTITATRSTTIRTTSQLYTVGSSSALKGQTTFYLWQNSGSSDYLRGLQIARSGAAGGGGGTDKITTTLSWTPALESDAAWNSAESRLDKKTGDADFTFTASTTSNTLGTITYSSSNTGVATVTAGGTVHIVGAAGDATITATMAESGCYKEATISYNIHVEDNCDDTPGKVMAYDLGCDGTLLVVVLYDGMDPEAVNYQWYRDGVSLGESYRAQRCTVTVAGEYYVVVDNTAAGEGHCAMASENTVEVEARAGISAEKIVDSWYVKNGRRTPDIELVQTTGATGFVVKIGETVIWNSDGSVSTGFGGCDFRLGENGIIYLNGTKTADHSAPSGLTAGEVTLTITAKGCGSDATPLNITIYCQAETTRKSIAFVVDGTEKGTFDQPNADHSTNSALYQFLDYTLSGGSGQFDLTAQNIYSSVDEKEIREHFSQFDGIIITDDPNTGKTKDKKSYVNAFGTMIDVRPILTMEAFVSKLANWKAKGINGNPESPNPRQYAMTLQCKDHEIFFGIESTSPNVAHEEIDGVDYWTVTMVDKTKSPYSGMSDTEDTDGTPALQGFSASDVSGLLLLGEIKNGDKTMYAGVERQEEPAARLMLLGIQNKALPNALTTEGKTIIENAVTYLLKTNMEEVDDCSNYFIGGGGDNSWETDANWFKGKAPNSPMMRVRILAPCEVSTTVHAAHIDIVTSGESSKKGGEMTGQLTIKPNGAVIVGGEVRAAAAPYFNKSDLKPTEEQDLKIETSNTGQGALILNNDAGDTKATVEYYSLGRKDGGAYQFQYFASPMGYLEINPAFAGAGIYTYAWNEAVADGWERRAYYTDVLGFEGLAITTKRDYISIYTLKGALASTADIDIALTHTDAGAGGQNLIGNSWTAPINIASLVEAFDDDDNVTKTVNIYNSGDDVSGAGASAGSPGTWTAVPIAVAEWPKWTGLKVIPAMQAFRIDVTSETKLTMNYEKMVRQTESTSLNEPLKAPSRRSNANGASLMRMRLESGMGYTDLFLIEGEQFSEAFDNGYEAKFIAGEDNTVQFYAMNGEEKMAVLATDALEGTPVGFVPGKGTAYTISFSGDGMGYYLNDVKKQTSTLISEENTYSFDYEAGDDANRFYISATPFSMPQITTGMENLDAVAPKVQKVVYNDKMYIIRGGKVFSADGQLVK